MTALVGLDVGTTGVKALAVAPDGEVLARQERESPLALPHPRWAEQVIGGTGGPTIGAAGCALTAAATVFQYYGATSNPNQVLTGCDLAPTTSLRAASGCTGFMKAAFGLRFFFVAIVPPSGNKFVNCAYNRGELYLPVFFCFSPRKIRVWEEFSIGSPSTRSTTTA